MPATSEKLKRAAAAQKLLRDAREIGLDTDVPALAFEARLLPGVDPHSDRALLDRVIEIVPVPHPILDALMETTGATRRGSMTYQVGFGENYTDAAFRALTTNVRRGLVWPEELMRTTSGARDLTEYDKYYNKGNSVQMRARGTAAQHFWTQNYGAISVPHPTDATSYGAIGLSFTQRSCYIKVFTHQVNLPAWLPQVNLNLNPADDKAARDPKPVLATHAIEVLEWLAAEGVLVVDPDPNAPIATLRKRIAESVVAYPSLGKPAMAEISVGRKVRELVNLDTPAPGDGNAATRGTVPAQRVEEALRAVPEVAGVVHDGTRDAGRLALATPFEDERLREYQQVAVGRHLATNVGYLNASSPGMGKTVMALSGMRERAKNITNYRGLLVVEANVRHQWGPEAAKWFPEATVFTYGGAKDNEAFINAVTEAGDKPFVGIISYAALKNVHDEVAIRLEAEREAKAARARRRQVVEPIDGRDIGENTAASDDSTPEAQAEMVNDLLAAVAQIVEAPAPVVVVDEESDQMALFAVETEVVADESGETVRSKVVLTTEAQTEEPETAEPEIAAMATLGSVLLDTYWHDLIADEAEPLRNTGNKQGAALWELRKNSQVAVALTGTPINRGVDDLGRLVSWCRGDANLFHGVQLSTQFNLADNADLAALQEAMGGVMFRADISEVSEEVPDVSTVIMKLKPSPAEKALADAARMELKRVYDELMEAIEEAEKLDPDNEAYAEARAGLRQARGAHLGGTTLARMASSDPAALIGSESAGAALLAGQGLVEAATRQTGTKRAAVVADVVERVAAGEAVLVFTEFATVATGLIADLDAAGVKVGEVLGGGGAKRDRMIEEFKAGDLDVLVCTSSGEKGLNLQRASTIVHYDLPWAPKGVLQRTGRALRLESANQKITLVFPLMEGTVEERVAATVVRRALEAMYALDKSRGVDISKTEIGRALGGLAETVADTSEGRSHANELMEITRQLVGS